MKNEFKIKDVPIFWRESSQIIPIEGIPSRMDIKIVGRQSWGGISLETTEELIKTLERIYLENENIGYLQDDNPLAELYAPEYITFIEKHIETGSHISEIGAGGCYSLQKLKKLGYRVSAIDPSPITAIVGKKHDINVVPEFFPTTNSSVLKNVDACIHYDVLEHVEYPEKFLRSIYDGLPNGGKTVFVVPDSTLHIEQADISMCLHQHLNYFTDLSLRNLLIRVGFNVEALHRSSTTGTIFCSAVKSVLLDRMTPAVDKLHYQVEKQENSFFINVGRRYEETVRSITALLEKNGGQKVGFYPPLRAIPYLSLLTEEFGENIVFVDDNTKVQGRYICDLEFPIRSRQEALDEGVSSFLICSKPFKHTMTGNLLAMESTKELAISYLDDLSGLVNANEY